MGPVFLSLGQWRRPEFFEDWSKGGGPELFSKMWTSILAPSVLFFHRGRGRGVPEFFLHWQRFCAHAKG